MIIYDHNYGFWMSNKGVFLLPLSLLYSDLGLGLYTLVSNFPKSSLNALNNILQIVKKINRFSELTSAALMHNEYAARKSQREIRVSGVESEILSN